MESETLKELDKSGAETIRLLKDFAEQGIEFVQQQSPELCREIVLRDIAQSWMLLITFVIVGIILISCSRWLFNVSSKSKYEDEKVCGQSFGAVGVILGIVSIMVSIGVNGYNLVSVYVAPKVFLVEYFTNLATGA